MLASSKALMESHCLFGISMCEVAKCTYSPANRRNLGVKYFLTIVHTKNNIVITCPNYRSVDLSRLKPENAGQRNDITRRWEIFCTLTKSWCADNEKEKSLLKTVALQLP